MLFHDSVLCHISYSLFQIPFLHPSANQLVLAFETSTSSKKPFLPRLQLFSSVQSLSHVQLFATPWTAALQASLSFTNSKSLLKLMSTESVMSSNHLTLCCPLLLLPSIFPSIRVFSNESVLHIRWPQYWSFSFSTSPSNEYSRLISLGLTGLISQTLKSLPQHYSLKASVLQHSAFFRRKQWQPSPVLLPGKSHGRRSLVGSSPWGH